MSHPTSRMLTRIKSVYLFIRERETVTTTEIAEEFDVTTRTVQRDLNVLAYNDLVKSPNRGKWMITTRKVNLS